MYAWEDRKTVTKTEGIQKKMAAECQQGLWARRKCTRLDRRASKRKGSRLWEVAVR